MTSLEKLARLYVDEVVRLHGVLLAIVSDREARFTQKFWQALQEELETKIILVPHTIPKLIDKVNGPFKPVMTCYGHM